MTEGGSRQAQQRVDTFAGLSARDAVHLAIMARHGVDRIMTFDRAFDGISGVVSIRG